MTPITTAVLIIAQANPAKPMGMDFSGPNALVASVFGLFVGICAVRAIWLAMEGKPALLLGILGCVLIAAFIFRFTDVRKARDNDVFDGIEQVGGIDNGDPAPAPPTTR